MLTDFIINTGYSMCTHCSFYATKNKLDFNRGKRFCKDLKKHAAKLIGYEKEGNDTISLQRE